MSKVTFRGAGLNAASMLTAVTNANDSPSRKTLPAGATWPLVTLTIGKDTIDFRMPSVHKSATVQNLVGIELSRYGYVFFHTKDKANDFGFCTMRLDNLISELSSRGYCLGETVQSNRRLAKVSLFAMVAIFLIIFMVVTTMGILKPNGV